MSFCKKVLILMGVMLFTVFIASPIISVFGLTLGLIILILLIGYLHDDEV